MPKLTRLLRETAVPFSVVAAGVAFLHFYPGGAP